MKKMNPTASSFYVSCVFMSITLRFSLNGNKLPICLERNLKVSCSPPPPPPSFFFFLSGVCCEKIEVITKTRRWHASQCYLVIRYIVMLWQLKCLQFLLMDLLWNTNIWRVTQDCNNHFSLSFILHVLYFMYAISGKILLEKKDYMIIALEMMVSGKFVGICSRSHTLAHYWGSSYADFRGLLCWSFSKHTSFSRYSLSTLSGMYLSLNLVLLITVITWVVSSILHGNCFWNPFGHYWLSEKPFLLGSSTNGQLETF